nr:hypothetical protein [Tanacetum cinerariifolium]
GQPNGPITASPEVPLFTSKEFVAEYHSITTSVQLIENVGDGDPLIILKELAAVKQRMNAIERFIKSKNDNLSEDSVANQSVKKEIKSSDGKANNVISNGLIGETSCQNLVKKQLQSRDICIQSITNQIVQHPLESPKGKSSESEIINVLTGQVSCDKNIGGFYECESLKLYYTDPKEYPSSSMT